MNNKLANYARFCLAMAEGKLGQVRQKHMEGWLDWGDERSPPDFRDWDDFREKPPTVTVHGKLAIFRDNEGPFVQFIPLENCSRAMGISSFLGFHKDEEITVEVEL